MPGVSVDVWSRLQFGNMVATTYYCVLNLIIFIVSVQSNTYEIHRILQTDMLRNYSKDVRPVTFQTDAVHVNMSFLAKALNKFNEIEGVLDMVCGLTLTWRDELMQWNPSNYGQTTILRLPMSKVWTPSLFLINSATSFQVNLGDDKVQSVTYFFDGSAMLTTGIITSTICSPNVTYYPFDSHHCSLEFTSLVLPEEVNLHIETHINTYAFEPNTIWELESAYGSEMGTTGISLVKANIRIKRRPTFLLINIFAPILFLALANLFVFAIPIESGERVSFAVTILLSFAVFLTLVTDKMPQTSLSLSLFSLYLILTMTYSSLIMLALAFILSIYFTEDNEPTGPFTNFMLCLFTQKKFRRPTSNKLNTVCELDSDNIRPNKAPEDRKVCTSSGETSRMKTLASKLDKCCGIAFLVFFIVITIIFMSVLSSA